MASFDTVLVKKNENLEKFLSPTLQRHQNFKFRFAHS